MKKIIFSFFLIFIITNYNNLIKAEGENVIHAIYSDLSVNKDEEFVITLNFDQVQNYSTIQVVMELGSYFEINNEVPCEMLVNSYFTNDEIYVNSIEDNVLRFVAFKKNTNAQSSFNNIFQITLKSKINCEDVSEYIGNINIGLFDSNYQIIPVSIVTSEGIKVEWLEDLYIIELGENLPNFIDDIKVVNRSESEYVIRILVDDINLIKIGPQVVTVYIFDYTNSSCLYLSRAINIVDLIKPTISGKSELIINDYDLDINNLHNFTVEDNYDTNCLVEVSYYDVSGNIISNKEKFLEYLKTNQIGSILVSASDSSRNESDEFRQTIKIIDTVPPLVDISSEVEVLDHEIDNFDILNFLKVTDSYDQNPTVYYYLNGTLCNDIIGELSSKHQIELTIIAKDLSNNQSLEKLVTITLKDTTPPQLTKLSDIEINDNNFLDLKETLLSSFSVVDNFSNQFSFEYIYYNNDSEINYDEFYNFLYSGVKLKVDLKAFDEAMNASSKISIYIKLIDTTSPTVKITNVEEGKKYLSINKIEYDISDNFRGDLDINILLDNEVYNGTIINIIGNHTLTITATDQAGNKTEQTINFEIVKNNLIGCGLDTSCYTENYKTIIYIAFIILFISLVIVIGKVVVKKTKKKVD